MSETLCPSCEASGFKRCGHKPLERPRCECHACTQARSQQAIGVYLLPLAGMTRKQEIITPRDPMDDIVSEGVTRKQAIINAERERCAAIADKYTNDPKLQGLPSAITSAIAARIRDGE